MSANKDLSNQSFSGRFFRSCVWMWELGHKESWVPKNWCFWTVVLDKTLESSLNSRRSNLPSYRRSVLNIPSKEYSQLMVMLKLQTLTTQGRELTLWKRPCFWAIAKAEGKVDERWWDCYMASPTRWMWVWPSLGVGEGPLQGSLVCCSPFCPKESGTTEPLNCTELRPFDQ